MKENYFKTTFFAVTLLPSLTVTITIPLRPVGIVALPRIEADLTREPSAV